MACSVMAVTKGLTCFIALTNCLIVVSGYGAPCTTVHRAPHCNGIQTTAPTSLVSYIAKINSLDDHNLAALLGANTYCRSPSCIQSAKGLLCLAMNGGVAWDVPRDMVSIKAASDYVAIPNLELDPPVSGLAITTGIPVLSGDNSADWGDELLDMHIPESIEGNMFCLDGVPAQDHPPCFTQCMDLLTPLCENPCPPGKDSTGVLPCHRDGVHINPVCVIKKVSCFPKIISKTGICNNVRKNVSILVCLE